MEVWMPIPADRWQSTEDGGKVLEITAADADCDEAEVIPPQEPGGPWFLVKRWHDVKAVAQHHLS